MQLLFSLSTLAILLSSVVTTMSAPVQQRAVEDKPWQLSKFIIFKASPSNTGVSSISFKFQDINEKIEMATDCQRQLAPGSNSSGLIDTEKYYPCANSTVAFKYDGSSFFVKRSYRDPDVDPGYNYYSAFGNVPLTNITTRSYPAGTIQSSAYFEIPITALTA